MDTASSPESLSLRAKCPHLFDSQSNYNLPQFSYHEGQHPLVFAFVQYYYFVAENDDGHLWMNHSQGNEAELEVLGRGVWQLGHDFDNKLLDPPWTFNRK